LLGELSGAHQRKSAAKGFGFQIMAIPAILAILAISSGVWHKLVSQPAHREQIAWFCRLIFYIPPQPDNKVVNGSRVGILVQVPHIFQN
jgi:hypothetical protein